MDIWYFWNLIYIFTITVFGYSAIAIGFSFWNHVKKLSSLIATANKNALKLRTVKLIAQPQQEAIYRKIAPQLSR